DFKNTILILTSNLGSEAILEGIDQNGNITDEAKATVNDLLRRSFRPEFLNRLDEVVFYRPLTRENISKIVDLMLEGLRQRLDEKHLKLEVTDSAKAHIIGAGYDPVYGARPLRRYLQSAVETLVARKIIEDDPAPDTVFTLDFDGSALTLK
ncbi:MAG: AAA family ATPase, partial [Clostridia bacterium]|nr:AAA family ATPase [Clostridia bacterium]MDY6184211.1 AAA family ATPase [Eubacteriales bacterium]